MGSEMCIRDSPGTDTVSSFPAGTVTAGYGGSGGGDSRTSATGATRPL